MKLEVWREWSFAREGIVHRQPKWVNTTHTQPFLPRQRTPVDNLVLAGAHTRTDADLWSIEAAVESGRRAAAVLTRGVPLIREHVPWPIRLFRRADDVCYRAGAPHVLDLLLGALVAGAAAVAVPSALRRSAGRRGRCPAR